MNFKLARMGLVCLIQLSGGGGLLAKGINHIAHETLTNVKLYVYQSNNSGFFCYYFLLQHDFRDPKFVQMELPFKFLTANNILPDVSDQKLQHLSDDIANTVEPDDVIQGVDVDRKAIVAHVDKLHFYEVCSRLYATGTCCFNRYC